LYQNARSSLAKLFFYIIIRIPTQQTSAVTVECLTINIIAVINDMIAKQMAKTCPLQGCISFELHPFVLPCCKLLAWLTGSVTDKENVSEKLNEFRRQRYPREISLCQEER